MFQTISPGNLYSKISEFLFLFNHMHEFLHFYFFFPRGLQSPCYKQPNYDLGFGPMLVKQLYI